MAGLLQPLKESFLGEHAVAYIAAAAVLGLFVLSSLRTKTDPSEPPLVRSWIPGFGHLIGLLTRRAYYWRDLARANPDKPAFTVSMGGQKMYIIQAPQLIQAAMRNKMFSFAPLTTAFAERMVGHGPNIQALMVNPHASTAADDTAKYDSAFMSDQHRAYDQLAPGPALWEMNARVLTNVSVFLNNLGPNFETKGLYMWIRDAFTAATSEALFGRDNPLSKDPTLNDSLWDFEGGQLALLVGPWPAVTAAKPYTGRTRVSQALRQFYREGHDQNSDVSSIIKHRGAVCRKHGLPLDDVADHEVGMLFVSITNAIPTLVWMMCYVFHDPQLLADLQAEALEAVQDRINDQGVRECTFDISKFSTTAPLLNATYNEVMRLTGRQAGTRTLLGDTTLTYTPTDGSAPRTFLFKRGCNVQMPSMITMWDEATWGPTVNEFNPRRFIDRPREVERVQNRAFTPFGGGKHLCPGRHFAYAEILGAMAALVLGYEIETPEGGRIAVPPINNTMVEAIAKPTNEYQKNMLARIRRRPGWEDVSWNFVAGSSK